MEYDHYDVVPPVIADKVISAARAAGHGKEEEEE